MSTPGANFSRHYTLAEAKALLPEIRLGLEQLQDSQARLRTVEASLSVLLAKHGDQGGNLVNELTRTVAECKGVLHKFAAREIQIKDIERGLIDFPSWRDGREVFLCWEMDEPDIEFWHDLECGYAGRERV